MKKRKEVIICMVFLLLVSLAVAIDSDVDGWHLDPGDILYINVHGICKIVTNFDTVSSFFVPTFTSGEWDAFISNPPENVSVVEYIDCNGDCFGTASEDNCGTCVGGNTGINACVQDCADAWGGDSVLEWLVGDVGHEAIRHIQAVLVGRDCKCFSAHEAVRRCC